jgi:glutaredoxin 3
MENIVYSSATCPFCIMVKQILTEEGVEFKDVILETREEIEKFKAEYNWRTVPIVILNGKFIGGFNETKNLIVGGGLKELLEN